MGDELADVRSKGLQRICDKPFLAWGLVWLVLLALLPNLLNKLDPVTGDEPFYLMTAISLLHDHDLDEANNYAAKDYWEFAPSCQEMSQPNWGDVGDPPINNVAGVLAPGLRSDCKGLNLPLDSLSTLSPHTAQGTIRPGQYTKHGIGLPALIAPAFDLGNRPLVVIFIAALAALVAVNVWLLAFETAGKRKVAWFTYALMAFSVPLLPFSFLIFPAMPAALCTVYAWQRLRLSARAQQLNQPHRLSNNPLRSLAIGACIGFLPWLHSVYLIVSLMLFAYWALGGRIGRWVRQIFFRQSQGQPETRRILKTKDRLAALFPAGWSRLAVALFFLPVIVFGALFVFYYVYYFGTPLPNTPDHAGFAPIIEIPTGLLGLLFDQKYGMLIYGPFYLLALCGCWLMLRRQGDPTQTSICRSDLSWLLLVAGPYLLIMGDYKQWWGEWGPPARYLVPVVPLLAVPLSHALFELKGWLAKGFLWIAAAWSLAFSVIFMCNPHVMYNWQTANPATSLRWLETNIPFLKDASLGKYFPSYATDLTINDSQANWVAAAIWLGAALILAAALIVFGEGKPEPPTAYSARVQYKAPLA
jgi:hypothetical protein